MEIGWLADVTRVQQRESNSPVKAGEQWPISHFTLLGLFKCNTCNK